MVLLPNTCCRKTVLQKVKPAVKIRIFHDGNIYFQRKQSHWIWICADLSFSLDANLRARLDSQLSSTSAISNKIKYQRLPKFLITLVYISRHFKLMYENHFKLSNRLKWTISSTEIDWLIDGWRLSCDQIGPIISSRCGTMCSRPVVIAACSVGAKPSVEDETKKK